MKMKRTAREIRIMQGHVVTHTISRIEHAIEDKINQDYATSSVDLNVRDSSMQSRERISEILKSNGYHVIWTEFTRADYHEWTVTVRWAGAGVPE